MMAWRMAIKPGLASTGSNSVSPTLFRPWSCFSLFISAANHSTDGVLPLAAYCHAQYWAFWGWGLKDHHDHCGIAGRFLCVLVSVHQQRDFIFPIGWPAEVCLFSSLASLWGPPYGSYQPFRWGTAIVYQDPLQYFKPICWEPISCFWTPAVRFAYSQT